jgi:hypothetical protein
VTSYSEAIVPSHQSTDTGHDSAGGAGGPGVHPRAVLRAATTSSADPVVE